MEELIFSFAPTQIENGLDLSIAGVFSQLWRLSLKTINLDMLTSINKNLQFQYQLNNEGLKYEDIDLMEEYLK